MPRIVETLLYRLVAGSGAEFDRIMHEVSVPLHRSEAMDVVAYGNSLDDPDAYFLIRAYGSLDHLTASQAAFYSSDAWRSGPREAIVRRIETAHRCVSEVDADGVEVLRRMRRGGEGG